jgi:hypothetical protein
MKDERAKGLPVSRAFILHPSAFILSFDLPAALLA